MRSRIPITKFLKPDLEYFQGDTLVPSKAVQYKKEPKTGEVIEIISPRTRQFENDLRKYLASKLNIQSGFPIKKKKQLLVIITHGFRSKKEYKKCDLDNRAKTLLDAMCGPVYFDDNQVKYLLTDKMLFSRKSTLHSSFFRIAISSIDYKKSARLRYLLSSWSRS